MQSKVLSLDQLPELVPDGASVALGGAWFSNHPMAAVRQLIRSGRRRLKIVSVLGSIDVELLIAAGAVDELTFSMVTLEAFGLAPSFRRNAESSSLRLREVTALALNTAIEAAARNHTFLPFHGPESSDIPKMHPEFYGVVVCPFTGRRSMAVRALHPDVAIIHAKRADSDGDAQLDGTFGIDTELARAARRVIITCEELVSRSSIEATSHNVAIPGFLVDAVVVAEFGAHPTAHVPSYGLDAWEIMRYTRLASGRNSLIAELDVLRSESEVQYRARVLPDNREAVLRELVNQARVLSEPN